MSAIRVLVIDLNNFARYPTIAVGYLASILRASDIAVTVYSPLAHGVPGIEREQPETILRSMGRRLSYLLAARPNPLISAAAGAVSAVRDQWAKRDFRRIVAGFDAIDPNSYDVVLISAYLMYRDVCEEVGQRCRARGLPLIVGGSYFASSEVASAWVSLPGLTALIGGEVELELADIVRAADQDEDLSRFAGVWLPSGAGGSRPPLTTLDQVPFPDYRDFPWDKYPNAIIPIISGRGCGWGVCTFCSDVTSSAGRTFRSRSPENVLAEIELQSARHNAQLFAFTDLKLNSNESMWDALIANIQSKAPNANWICSVHVDRKLPNGLDRNSLVRARQSGLVRVTTGLESGSQRVLDRMAKGTDLAETSRFLADATSAGISVRVTMIHGYPGEEPEDVIASAEFLERNSNTIDRVSLNRFQIMLGPSFLRRYAEDPSRFPDVRNVVAQPALAIASHERASVGTKAHIRATQRLLSAVHQINCKPLRDGAAQFEGVM